MNSIEVYFHFFGDDFDPDVITEEISVQPTSIIKRGCPGEYVKINNHSDWTLSTGAVDGEFVDINELTKSILKLLEGKEALIVDISKKYGVRSELQIVINASNEHLDSFPVIGFDSSVICFLSSVNASIDFDMYFM